MSNELNNDLINTNTNIDELQTEEDHDITMMDENLSDNITQEQQHPYLNGHVYLPIISNIGDSLDKLEYDSRLLYIAESNDINISWEDIQLIIRDLILKQCDIMIEKISDSSVLSTINNIKISILHCIDQHTGIPFTIQRICELITSPSKHYNSFVKYLNAVEKMRRY
ncbi:hypothetical protein BJ944DRAFT_88707 [Cunninghamella echinulata]|nr:hypothetical protein BJ944DRAFT_88707 [Cunninghamella echinulata]